MSFKKGDGSSFDAPTAVSTTDKILVAENGVVKEAALSDLPIDTLLTPTGVTSGAYGTSTAIARFVVNEDGRIVSAVAIPIAITSVNTLLNVSIASPASGDVLFYTSATAGGEWKNFTPGSLFRDSVVSNNTLDDSGVIAGTYGDPGLIPQLTVNTKGRVTGVTQVTAFTSTGVTSGTYGAANLVPQFEVDVFGRIRSVTNVSVVGGGGGAVVTALDDVLDVSVPSPTDGQVLTWRTNQWVASAPFITSQAASVLISTFGFITSASASSMINSFGYITSASASVLTEAILSVGQYMTSQETSVAINAFGFITSASASVLTEAILSVGQYMTSQETSVAINAFGFLTSTSASAMYAYRGFGAVSASNARVSASGQYQVLDLVGGNSISTSASGNRVVVKYTGTSVAVSNSILKYYRQDITTVSGTNSMIPRDATPPLISEGGNLVSVDYVPSRTGSRLQLRWKFYFQSPTANSSLVTPLFIDGRTTSYMIEYRALPDNGIPYMLMGTYFVSTSATTTITFNLRYGVDTATSVHTNSFGSAGGNNNLYGSGFSSFFEITEYAG